MPIDIKIEADLSGFSDQAKALLAEATLNYAHDVIDEANRIEAGRASTQGDPEVTRGMVHDAVTLLRRGLAMPKTKLHFRVLRILAAVLPLLVGVLYDPAKLQSSGYMAFFILVVAAAILAVTISILWE